ncbi:thioesterase II family protein [Streptomyces sp. NPDC019531]|uniref:thioesterase II family protein n=1 Tax=Streptomyces sp. NPDC019531 TaxID=3365062 RepID=UPI00384F844C
MGGSTVDGGRWARRFHPTDDAEFRLFCFPHAGGSASFFFPLSQELGQDPANPVDVLAVQYPGRQDRRSEENVHDMSVLADQAAEALLPCADRPFALFGHSMGATLAYEVARRLEEAGRSADALFVSGRRAPHRVLDDGLHALSDSEIIDDIKALDGTGSAMLGTPDLMRMILPAIRADYTAAETYTYAPGPVLTCPIHAFTGYSDPRVPVAELHHWSAHTKAPFDLLVFPGGHFYLSEHWCEVSRAVVDRLAGRTVCP